MTQIFEAGKNRGDQAEAIASVTGKSSREVFKSLDDRL
jgi:hypothetical protein